MAIDAFVEYVMLNEDGSGFLSLIDRAARERGQSSGIAGQRRLRFDAAPYEVTALNWTNVWGGSSSLMLGEREIARREGYTRIVFVDDEAFKAACALYNQRRRDEAQSATK